MWWGLEQWGADKEIIFSSLTLNSWHVRTCKINVSSTVIHMVAYQSSQSMTKYVYLH